MYKICEEIKNFKIVSEANTFEHFRVSGKRHNQQQYLIRALFSTKVKEVPIPCCVTLTRLKSHLLDDDNLVTSFKWIRDEISECIFPASRKSYVTKNGKIKSIKGRADCDPRIKWKYAQEKSKVNGIRIEIEPMENIPVLNAENK